MLASSCMLATRWVPLISSSAAWYSSKPLFCIISSTSAPRFWLALAAFAAGTVGASESFDASGLLEAAESSEADAAVESPSFSLNESTSAENFSSPSRAFLESDGASSFET